MSKASPTGSDPNFEFLGPKSVTGLNYNQKHLYANKRSDLIPYLQNKAKNPERNRGYSEANVRTVGRRIHQVHEFCWNRGKLVIELSPEDADQFVAALNDDTYRTRRDAPYAEGSKRKFVEALEVYFQFCDVKWVPEITFGQGESTMDSDPFKQNERSELLNASYEYKSPPNYKNVSPEERDRWKAYLAQHHGVPKESIGPEVWEEFHRSWKFPSLISVSLDIGPRAALIGRLTTTVLDLQNEEFVIPPEMAVKNNLRWRSEFTSKSAMMLEKWLEQRSNKTKYDGSDHIWLNRQGNPYNSSTLNNFLNNLIEISDIDHGNRKLTWHSIRHSTGKYSYKQSGDLGMVAKILRHKSIEAANRYIHPTSEAKREVIESIR
jgi:site-specific recombinase XerD